MSMFENLSGDQLTDIAAILAVPFSKWLSNSDINILNSIFSAISDNFELIAARNETESKVSNIDTSNADTVKPTAAAA